MRMLPSVLIIIFQIKLFFFLNFYYYIHKKIIKFNFFLRYQKKLECK